jgi:two-component system, chemotaxis family, sensor kinase CheA
LTELRQRLIAAFCDEQREYLEGIRAVLGRLERAPDGVAAAELDEAFRLAHCLKAAARVCDFRTVETIGQRIETFFAAARKGAVAGRGALDAVEQALAAVERWGHALADNPAIAQPADALEALDRTMATPAPPAGDADDLAPKLLAAFQVEHKEHLEEIRTILAGVAAGEAIGAPQVDEAFRRAHSLKGAARIAGLRTAEVLAHRLETLFAAVRDRQLPLDATVAPAIAAALDAIEDAAAAMLDGRPALEPTAALAAVDRLLGGHAESEAPPTAPAQSLRVASAAVPIESIRVSAENLDRLLGSAGQLLTESQRQNLVSRELTGLGRQIDELGDAWQSVRGGAALRRLADAPEFAAIARYLHLAEQRIGALIKKARSLRRLQQRSAWDLQHQLGRLHQDARRIRMVSAESVLQGFRKLVRDLARDEGKRIDFCVTGFEVQADRLVLQSLKDPLMHALFNAVSHGIEPPDERLRQGKTEVGRIELRLEIIGNRLRVAVEDDGQGIDPARIADAAVRRGLLSTAEAAALAPAEQARLIFRPGLSTVHKVTNVSGRGMGLSVVHEAAARLQGEAELEPMDGAGTRLTISVPLSVATQRLLLVACADQTFAVPVHAVERLLRVKSAEIEQIEGRPMVLRAGQPIPVRPLADLLGLSAAAPAESRHLLLVVLRAGAGRLAVSVDALLAERDSLLKDLDAPAAQVRNFAGGILLEDGSVVLVLNPAELLRAPAAADKSSAARAAAPPARNKQANTVLVVDDSLTTRTLEKSILEAHGYIVRIATDGVEALALLREEAVDLVITDVQMPRLDGFGLLAEIKKDPRLARLPVIVVTSMGKREDQERGLALGADAYIVKRKFDHEELLETIRQIL